MTVLLGPVDGGKVRRQSAARRQRRPLEHRGELDDNAAFEQAGSSRRQPTAWRRPSPPPILPPSCPHLARAAGPPGILKVVLESEVVTLDPHFSTAAITRTFGYHVYDTCWRWTIGVRSDRRWSIVLQARLRWTFQLRDGLRWHDGAPVTANACVALLRPVCPWSCCRCRGASRRQRQRPRSWRKPSSRQASSSIEQVMDWGTVLACGQERRLGAVRGLRQWHRHDLAAHPLLRRQHLRRLSRMELR
jgi:hypothetical protein